MAMVEARLLGRDGGNHGCVVTGDVALNPAVRRARHLCSEGLPLRSADCADSRRRGWDASRTHLAPQVGPTWLNKQRAVRSRAALLRSVLNAALAGVQYVANASGQRSARVRLRPVD